MSISDDFMLICPKAIQSNIIRKLQRALHFSLPIGVFWDIETCRVPTGKSAFAVVQNIREKFFENHREVEFVCVCDVTKQSRNVIEELIFAQVTVVHVSGITKSEACDKLKLYMKRVVVKQKGAPSTLILITENADFYSQLYDFRHCDETRIILIHRGHVDPSLLACVDEHYKFSAIASEVPSKISYKLPGTRLNLLLVSNLPRNLNIERLICILKKMSLDYGGRVFRVNGKHKAVIHFSTLDAAVKAQKQMHKQCIHGKEISVTFYCGIESDFILSPFKRNKFQTSSSSSKMPISSSKRPINSSKRLSSYSTRRGKHANKTHTPDLFCSKFDFSRIWSMTCNETVNLNGSIPSFVSTGFEEPFLHSLCHPENLPLDMKANVSENFDFGITPVSGFHCARNSPLDLQATEEESVFSDHTQGPAEERCLKNTEFQGSFSKSSAHIIPSEFSQNKESPLMSDESQNSSAEVESPICSKKDNTKKCFQHDPSKFEIKQDTKFKRNPSRLLEVSRCIQPANYHTNTSSEYRDRDHVQVEIVRSTFTSEREQNHRNRIVARFTIPMIDK